MINVSPVDRLMELLPEETRLVYQVKSGDINAFVKLYDVYIECIHRYVYIQVADDRACEGITFQTFFNAWKQLNDYKETGLPFISWLYSIAQNQVNAYYRTHKNSQASVQEFLISTSRHFNSAVEMIREVLQYFTQEERQVLILKYIVCMPVKKISRLMSMHEGDIRALQLRALQMLAGHLEEKEIKIKSSKFQRIFAECQIRLLNETSTLEEQLARYPEFAAQLAPLLRTVLSLASARNVNPLPTFAAYTREALLHYMASHPYRPQKNMVFSWRMASAFAVLIVALLATGTAQAQSALPGEPLYSWKRASEMVWRAVSLDPVSVDIFLAERRLDEWLAVVDNPERSASAKDGYLKVISRLQSASGEQAIVRIVPELRSQQQILSEAGLASNELNNYLVEAAAAPIATLVQAPATATRNPPTPTRIPPTATRIPPTVTEIPPMATEVPPTATQIQPTATEIPPTMAPTEVPPTVVPTEVPPTEIPPTPIETQPPETEVPTEIAPTAEPTFIPDVIPTANSGPPQ